jgi:hypothetical protein
MWLTFKRPAKNWTDAPVYFFEISPDTLRYGTGVLQRQQIDDGPFSPYVEATSGTVSGDS